jgi:hypothetical protein
VRKLRFVCFLLIVCLSADVFPQKRPRRISLSKASRLAVVDEMRQEAAEREERVIAVPYIERLVAVDLNQSRQFATGDAKLATFVVRNPDTSAFVLRLELDNGGAMQNDGRAGGIALGDFKLVYKSSQQVRVEKDISMGWVAGGRTYELEFSDLDRDVQLYYEMELWGAARSGDLAGAVPGVYSETMRFTIFVPDHLWR